jgi:RNA polymerase sigma factor (sigma-70 family)
MHEDIYQAIEDYYRSNRDRFVWYFSQRINCDYSSRAEEYAQEVFVALLQAAREETPPNRLDAYAWGIARNKLRMLYRSKDWQSRKSPLYDSTHPVSYDEDALCNAIDMHIRTAYCDRA